MNRFRLLAVSAALMLSGACTPVTPGECGPTTCTGCCDSSGVCQLGSTENTCGRNGAACAQCPSSQACSFGACMTMGGVGGGSVQGGGSAGGSTAGGAAAGGDAGGAAGGSTAGGAAGGDAGGSTAGGAAGGSTAGGSTAGGSTAGGSTAGGSTAGGSTAGGSTAGGSTAGGSTAGGSTAGGSTAGGSTSGGSTAGGSTAGGSTAGGSTAGGSTAGGSTAGGSTAGGSTAGGSASGVCPGSVTPCAGCCVGPLCVDFAAQNNSACGAAANACAPCANGTCTNGTCQVVALCNSSTCPGGCCQGNLCVPFGGQNASSCGSQGQACTACAPGNSCVMGACQQVGACDFFSCAGCCTNGNCQSIGSQTNSQCGVNGATCTACAQGSTCAAGICVGGATCNQTNCTGCCNGTTCVPASTTSPTSCGFSGNACVACAPGYLCTAGVCVPNPNTNCIAITPHDVDFGTVQTGCRSAPVQFTIQNICNTPQTISVLGVAGAGFTTSAVTLPQTLAVAQSLRFTVTFAPTSVGRVTSSLVVGVSAGATIAYQTPVTANGAATGANQDRFTIPTKTDVVMVVDNSGSMGTHQANLGANANAFLAYAFSANVDFNLGVTTTDLPVANGGFVGPVGAKVLRSTSPNLLQAFNNRVNVGTTGSGFEQMFAPAVASVTPPQITTTNVNFLRGDAALSILAYTDAVEQSSSTRNYLEELLRVKGQRRRNEFSFSFVGPTLMRAPTNCLYDGSTTPDPREVDMVRNTGGYFSEICAVANTQAWRLEATRVGRAVFGARSTWFLTGKPSPAASSSVTVTINGQSVPENGIATRNWSYDATRNAVVFEPNALPAPGQTVGIDYSVACMP